MTIITLLGCADERGLMGQHTSLRNTTVKTLKNHRAEDKVWQFSLELLHSLLLAAALIKP